MTGLKRGTVLLEPHSEEWDENAADVILKLKNILGNAAEDIQHIGSTAIKEIKAKPIIDIAVGMHDIDTLHGFEPELSKNGFIYRDNQYNGYLFVRGDFKNDIRTHHIHFVTYNSMEWRNYINFRDYLNRHMPEAKEYEKLKTELAYKYPDDRASYTKGKSQMIERILRDALVDSFLGKTVRIEIDRPIGYVHKKKTRTLVYPINYGYIPGVIGGDGEELDVYLAGVKEPVKEFEAHIIGIIHREDDEEDKLIGVPEGMILNQAEIAEIVYFQEKYHKMHVESIYQKSCGAVIFRKILSTATDSEQSSCSSEDYKIENLVLKQRRSGRWSFPKGHMERGETEIETAAREIYEETGLKPEIHTDFRESVSYNIDERIEKTNIFFIAETDHEPVIPQDEITDYRWANACEARKLLMSGYDMLIDKAEKYLRPYII